MFVVQSTMTSMNLARGGALVADPRQARHFSIKERAEAAARKATREFDCAEWPFEVVPYSGEDKWFSYV